MSERVERKHFRKKTIYSPEYEVFLRLLGEARKKAGLTQEEIAQRIEQDTAMVSRCFSGGRRVDIVETRTFLRAMGIPFSEFVLMVEAEWNRLEEASEE